jgi:hypothetical protein
MSKYFTNYPIIQYQGKQIRDITRRSKVRDELLSDPYIFLPYTIREGEKPETIAQLYYGAVDDTWLVLFANNITDPYYEWPMNEEEFNQFFIDKYSKISGRSGFDVIRWGLDETRTDNIVYNYRKSEDTNFIVRFTQENSQASGLSVRAYQYEKQQNDNKREIVLIDKIYRNKVVEEFRRSLRP